MICIDMMREGEHEGRQYLSCVYFAAASLPWEVSVHVDADGLVVVETPESMVNGTPIVVARTQTLRVRLKEDGP